MSEPIQPLGDQRLPPFTVKRVFTTLSETMDWGLKLLGVPNAWKITRGSGVRVAVLDTGADQTHVERGDLQGAVENLADFTGSRFGWIDFQGHGTHTAGTIGARQNNLGVIGVAPQCSLLIGKVLGDDGSGTSASVAAGIDWAVSQKADLISMSLGSPEPSPDIHAAILRAVKAGVFVVCAAGNEQDGQAASVDTVGYPARWPETVAVGAVDADGHVASFSSRGPEVDICAPGVDVLSTYLNGGYAKLSGTSMATPFVAGVVALAIAKHRAAAGGDSPLITPAQMIEHLTKYARPWNAGQGAGSGAGLIDPATVVGTDAFAVERGHKVGPFRISFETIEGVTGLFICVGGKQSATAVLEAMQDLK